MNALSQSRSTSEECFYIGYTPLLMATHDSELTALYMKTTNIVDSLKVVKGSTERSENLMSLCNESIMKLNKEN